ncbi:MAG: hypothetical protein P8016_13900 [Sedimentisphaerales bacterium]
MAVRPETGGINDKGARFSSDPANNAIDQLSQTVKLAFHISGKARLQMTIKAIYIGMI